MQCLGWKPQLSCYASIDGRPPNAVVAQSCKSSTWFYLALAAAAIAGMVSGKKNRNGNGNGGRGK